VAAGVPVGVAINKTANRAAAIRCVPHAQLTTGTKESLSASMEPPTETKQRQSPTWRRRQEIPACRGLARASPSQGIVYSFVELGLSIGNSSILPRLRDVAAIGNARSKGTLLGVASEQLIVLIAITMKENHLISLSEFRVCWKRESLVSFSGRMTVIRLDKNNCTLELNGRSANIAAKVN